MSAALPGPLSYICAKQKKMNKFNRNSRYRMIGGRREGSKCKFSRQFPSWLVLDILPKPRQGEPRPSGATIDDHPSPESALVPRQELYRPPSTGETACRPRLFRQIRNANCKIWRQLGGWPVESGGYQRTRSAGSVARHVVPGPSVRIPHRADHASWGRRPFESCQSDARGGTEV